MRDLDEIAAYLGMESDRASELVEGRIHEEAKLLFQFPRGRTHWARHRNPRTGGRKNPLHSRISDCLRADSRSPCLSLRPKVAQAILICSLLLLADDFQHACDSTISAYARVFRVICRAAIE